MRGPITALLVLAGEGPKGRYMPQFAAELPSMTNGGISPDGKTI
ncbi:MAG TPA: hypothetical protein VJT33_00710 [bacterium]|nr:hypothetical protein [bacterium]